jgi:hypothetical protein
MSMEIGVLSPYMKAWKHTWSWRRIHIATEITRGLIASRKRMDMRGVARREAMHPVRRHNVTINGNTEAILMRNKIYPKPHV